MAQLDILPANRRARQIYRTNY